MEAWVCFLCILKGLDRTIGPITVKTQWVKKIYKKAYVYV